MNRLVFLDPDAPADRGEWLEAWQRLRRMSELVVAPADRSAADVCPACCPDCGECWQYMGSSPYRDEMGGAWVHEFRHRCSRAGLRRRGDVSDPMFCGSRVYRRVMASQGWQPREVPPAPASGSIWDAASVVPADGLEVDR